MPPGIKPKWEDNSSDAWAYLISYSQVRELEEAESSGSLLSALFGARV